MKKLLKIALWAISILFIAYTTKAMLMLTNLYPYKLADNYYLTGNGMNYSIKHSIFSPESIINNIEGVNSWMITPKALYGNTSSFGTTEYYFIDRETDSVTFFETDFELNGFLKIKKLPLFNIAGSENIAHLKFSGSRKRKFR